MPSRHRLRRFARIGVAVVAATIGLLCVLRPPGFVTLVELKLLDWHALVRGPLAPPAGITVVAIDESSLRRIGHWPWPRSRTTELILRLAEGGARVVTLDLVLAEPDQNSSLALAQDLLDRYRQSGLARAGGLAGQFAGALEEALVGADTDRLLAEALAATGRVVLPYLFVFDDGVTAPIDDAGRRLLNRSRMVAFANREAEQALEPRRAPGLLLPLARFHQAAAASGHANVFPDRDGAVRRLELVLRYGDGYYPSFVLETARLALGLSRPKVRLTAEQRLDLGGRSVATDENGLMYLTFYGPRGTLRHLSAADVLTGTTPPPVDGHLVLVGFTAYGLTDVRPTPFDPSMPGVEINATALANLIEGRTLRRLTSMALLEAVVVLGLAACSPVAVARLGASWGTAIAVGIGAVTWVAIYAAFRAGTWVYLLPPLAALTVGHLGAVTYQILVEERERRWIKRAFQQYVPAEVVDAVAQNPEALAFGGERRAMTVLFSDIRGYTTYAERHPPEEVVAVLHEYLTEMVDVVFRHKGTLDKFIGDAVMALFGAPLADPEHALNACRAAVAMVEALDRLNARWAAEGRETLESGMGIASGEMVVGNLGSAQRFAYTVMGDQVNVAARLEGLNKDYKTRRRIILSDGVYAQVRNRVTVRPLGTVIVKGRVQPVDIYELLEVEPGSGEAQA